jgi:transcriptional regulator with GAF, ATPase, and Fis domain
MNVATDLNGSRTGGVAATAHFRSPQERVLHAVTEKPTDASDGDEGENPEAEVARALVTLADTLNEHFGVDSSLSHLVEVCRQLVPGAEVSVAIGDDSGKLRVAAASCERKKVIEQYQIDHNEGPTIDTFSTGEPSVVENFDDTSDQGPFVQLAKVVGYHAIQSIPLRLRAETIGVLSLAETSPQSRAPLQFVLLQALAEGTTIGILNHRANKSANELNRQLQGALTSRVLIEQAKGAVAARLGVTVDDAFDLLRRYARGSNRKLHDVSQAVIEGTLATHELWGSRRPSTAGSRRPRV